MEVEFSFEKASHDLRMHSQEMKQKHLRQMFAENPNRGTEYSIVTEYMYYDYSRQRVVPETIYLLMQLTQNRRLGEKISAMFCGEKINRTEGRAVLHTALRYLAGLPVMVEGEDVMPHVKDVLKRIKALSEQITSGQKTGVTGKKFRNIVAIGIGGSYLGPEFLAIACKPYALKGMQLKFIANIDGSDFIQKTEGMDPSETLVVVVSKTFTTAETMHNARTAREWMLQNLNNHPETIAKHFIAVSTDEEKVKAFGIQEANMFEFWDWVGGRYSATSAVGAVPLSLYLGFDRFQEILEGAHWMDQHFRTAPFHKNIPVMSGLIDIWNINFLGFKVRALLPYCQGLSRLAAYTQQGEMESNGKSVDIEGRPVSFDTGEVVFGEPGTNGQHSFYQLLHQGTQIIPADFIGFIEPQYPLSNCTDKVTHHEELMTNFFAQPDALAFGKDDPEPYKNFQGNRPCSVILLQKLDPFTAGLLLAWTEHRIAVKGFIWGINSFDQFGVELGKKLGVEHRKRIAAYRESGKLDLEGLNSSTASLLTTFLGGKLTKSHNSMNLITGTECMET